MNAVMSLLRSADIALPIEPSGPGLPTDAQLPGADVGEPEHLGADPEGHQLVLAGGVVVAPRLPGLDGLADEPGALRGHPAADGDPLVHEGGEHDPPAVARLAEALGVGDARVGEVHLVELGLAGDLVERPHLDARALHVDHEVGHALVLGRLGVGAGDEHPPLGEVGEGGPHLLAVDDPLVAVAHGLGGEAGDVGAGARLGEQLAPHLLAGEQRTQVALLLLVASRG